MNKPELRFFDDCLFHVPNGRGDVKTALGELVRLAAEGVNSTSASLYLVDAQGAVLKPLATFGLPEAYVKACGDVRVGDQCCGRAVEQRKPWVVADMATDPLFATAKQAAQLTPIKSGFSVPVIDYKGECYGSLACHYDRPHAATNAEIERTKIWATMIAYTISQYKGDGNE
jgi:GAF domain-containing protein